LDRPSLTAIRDTEYRNRGDLQAFFAGLAGAKAGRPALPQHCAGEKGSLRRPPQAHTDELGEEDAEAAVQERGTFLARKATGRSYWGDGCFH